MFESLMLGALIALAPPEYTVSLTNGHEYRVDKATLSFNSWELRVGGGVMVVPAMQIAAVKEGIASRRVADVESGIPVPAAIPAGGEKKLDPARYGPETTESSVVLRGVALQARVPSDYRRASAEEEGVAAFIAEKGESSIRLAWSEPKDSLWEMNVGIERHYEETYSGYRTISQRFTQIAGRLAWLLTFTHTRGKQSWTECQGFVVCNRGVLVVSAMAPSSAPINPYTLVRGVCESLDLSSNRTKGSNP